MVVGERWRSREERVLRSWREVWLCSDLKRNLDTRGAVVDGASGLEFDWLGGTGEALR